MDLKRLLKKKTLLPSRANAGKCWALIKSCRKIGVPPAPWLCGNCTPKDTRTTVFTKGKKHVEQRAAFVKRSHYTCLSTNALSLELKTIQNVTLVPCHTSYYNKTVYLLANTTWVKLVLEHLNTATSAMKSSEIKLIRARVWAPEEAAECRQARGAHHPARRRAVLLI